MRIPTLSEFLFALSMIFFITFVYVFNSELVDGKPLCELNLLNEHQETCILTISSQSNFRVVIHSGGSSKTVTIKVPITIKVSDGSGSREYKDIIPKSAGTGGGRRFYSNLNYGIYELNDNSEATVSIVASDIVNEFSLFNAKILEKPTNYNVYLFGFIFLAILFFSIYTRKQIFIKGIGKPFLYILYLFVATLVMTWAL